MLKGFFTTLFYYSEGLLYSVSGSLSVWSASSFTVVMKCLYLLLFLSLDLMLFLSQLLVSDGPPIEF